MEADRPKQILWRSLNNSSLTSPSGPSPPSSLSLLLLFSRSTQFSNLALRLRAISGSTGMMSGEALSVEGSFGWDSSRLKTPNIFLAVSVLGMSSMMSEERMTLGSRWTGCDSNSPDSPLTSLGGVISNLLGSFGESLNSSKNLYISCTWVVSIKTSSLSTGSLYLTTSTEGTTTKFWSCFFSGFQSGEDEEGGADEGQPPVTTLERLLLSQTAIVLFVSFNPFVFPDPGVFSDFPEFGFGFRFREHFPFTWLEPFSSFLGSNCSETETSWEL